MSLGARGLGPYQNKYSQYQFKLEKWRLLLIKLNQRLIRKTYMLIDGRL
jgi:hypothetical protein